MTFPKLPPSKLAPNNVTIHPWQGYGSSSSSCNYGYQEEEEKVVVAWLVGLNWFLVRKSDRYRLSYHYYIYFSSGEERIGRSGGERRKKGRKNLAKSEESLRDEEKNERSS